MLELRPTLRPLGWLLMVFGLLSLVHFTHNAAFLADYPSMPRSWTPIGVIAAWVAMTAIGVAGWTLLRRGHHVVGLLILMLYAVCGLDSLMHYVAARYGDHTSTMNLTIIAEAFAAGVVLIEALRLTLSFARLRLRTGPYA